MARLIAVATLIAVFGLINGQIETIANLLSPQAPGRNSCNARFDVRVSSPSPMRGLLGDRLNFQDAQINEGGWDGVNHEFRAPCKGLYYFHFEARAPARGEFILSLMQNYQNQVATHGGEGGDLIGSNSALLLLDQGEIVHLELQGKLEQRHTSFSGILVERL